MRRFPLSDAVCTSGASATQQKATLLLFLLRCAVHLCDGKRCSQLFCNELGSGRCTADHYIKVATRTSSGTRAHPSCRQLRHLSSGRSRAPPIPSRRAPASKQLARAPMANRGPARRRRRRPWRRPTRPRPRRRARSCSTAWSGRSRPWGAGAGAGARPATPRMPPPSALLSSGCLACGSWCSRRQHAASRGLAHGSLPPWPWPTPPSGIAWPRGT